MTSILRRTFVVAVTVLTVMAATGSAASASGRSAHLPVQTHV
jgi:hypothetical protein